MKFFLLSLVLLGAASTVGCATEFGRVDKAMGKSVTQMVRLQTLNPAAVAHPPALAPQTADGQRLENVLKALRKDVPQDISQPVQTPQFSQFQGSQQ